MDIAYEKQDAMKTISAKLPLESYEILKSHNINISKLARSLITDYIDKKMKK